MHTVLLCKMVSRIWCRARSRILHFLLLSWFFSSHFLLCSLDNMIYESEFLIELMPKSSSCVLNFSYDFMTNNRPFGKEEASRRNWTAETPFGFYLIWDNKKLEIGIVQFTLNEYEKGSTAFSFFVTCCTATVGIEMKFMQCVRRDIENKTNQFITCLHRYKCCPHCVIREFENKSI